jgi:glycosyltransferase involved in cell wall biosynthesis
MKILYLAAYGSNFPSRDANSIHIMRMCEAISKLGHEVILVISDRGSNVEAIFEHYGIDATFAVDIIKIPTVKGKTLIYAFKSSRRSYSYRPDLIITRSALLGAMSVKRNLPVVYDSHSPVWERSFLELLSFRFLIRNNNLRKMITNSAALKEMYIEKGLVPAGGITVAHNGSVLSSHDNKPEIWPGRENVMQIGYTGHLYPGRGIETVIECANQVPDCDFHIIGGGKKDIVYWAAKTQMENLFFHGFIRHSEIYKYRNKCDVLLAPYRSEKIAMAGGKGDQSKYMNPIKIVEYMSSMKAIISSDLPTIREILDDNSAILVPAGDTKLWVSAINKMRDPETRRKFATNAFNKFAGNLTWEKRAETFLA